jgi:hypothetical protein
LDISIAGKNDLYGLLNLYTQLHENKMPFFDEKLNSLWDSIICDKKHYIIVGKVDNTIISSCTLIVMQT